MNKTELKEFISEKSNMIKKEAISKIQNGKDWAVNNKEVIIVLAPVAFASLKTITKVVGKNVNLRKEESIKKLYCYDRSLGHYWSLKRELRNSEWASIEKRKQNGESLSGILASMNVLK